MKSFRELTAIGKVFAIAYLVVLVIGIGMSFNYIQTHTDSPDSNQEAQSNDLNEDTDKADQTANQGTNQSSEVADDQDADDSDNQATNDTTGETNDTDINTGDTSVEDTDDEAGTEGLYTHEDLEKLRSAIVVIAFNHQSFKLNENDQHELDEFISILKLYPEEKIAVEGHANGYPLFENTTLEIALSQNRAESVKSYLINHGIMESQITIVNFGSSLPLSQKESEQSLNDRVVVYSVDHVMSEGEGK